MRAPWCTVPIRCAGSRVRLPKDSAVRKIMCNIYSSCYKKVKNVFLRVKPTKPTRVAR